MKKYPILQSGFISFTEETLLTPVKYNDLVISNVLSKDYRSPSNRYFYSKPLSMLYNKWLGNPDCLRDFDTREQLLKLAKTLFATPSFFKWMQLQMDHGEIGSLHETFLIDTLEYLSGRTRRIETPQWVSLIEKAIKSYATQVNIAQFFDKEKYPQIAYTSMLSSSTVDILQTWVSRSGGYEDLLISLYVIFGNRPYITDVSENPRT